MLVGQGEGVNEVGQPVQAEDRAQVEMDIAGTTPTFIPRRFNAASVGATSSAKGLCAGSDSAS